MRKIVVLLLIATATWASAQTYTKKYPAKEWKKAAKWTKKGKWRNGFDKAKPADVVSRTNWRDIQISDNVKSMTVGVSSLSSDPRTDKELLIEALDEKYR